MLLTAVRVLWHSSDNCVLSDTPMRGQSFNLRPKIRAGRAEAHRRLILFALGATLHESVSQHGSISTSRRDGARQQAPIAPFAQDRQGQTVRAGRLPLAN